MAFGFGRKWIVILITSFQLLETNSEVVIEIQPEQYSDIFPEDVQISCRPKGLEKKVRDILQLQVFRKGEKPLAEVHPNINSVQGQQFSNSKYEVNSHIDADLSLSSLNVTLLKPGKEWAGTYTCKIYYLDDSGRLVEETDDGTLTVSTTDPAILTNVINPLLKRIAAVEDKAKILEGKTNFLNNKATQCQDEVAFLKKKTSLIENEKAVLKKKTATLETEIENKVASLQNQIQLLVMRTKSIETEASTLKAADTSTAQKIVMMQAKQALMETKLDKKYMEIDTKVNGHADKASVSSIGNRLAVLEKINQKEMTNFNLAKASMSSLRKRVGSLEQEEGDLSSQIKLLVSKDSAIESGLKKTDQKLLKEVKNRLVDKTSLDSTIKKVSSLERENGDQSKEIQEAVHMASVVEDDLQKAKQTLTKEMADRLSDKASTTSQIKKVSDLVLKNEGRLKQIESSVHEDSALYVDLKKKYSDMGTRLDVFAKKSSVSAIENRVGVLEKSSRTSKSSGDAVKNDLSSLKKIVGIIQQHENDHSKQIKSLVTKDSFLESSLKSTDNKLSQEVTNRLAKVSSLEGKNGLLSKRIQGLTDKDAAIEKKLQEAEENISQEVTNRINGDKSIVASNTKIVGDIQRKSQDQSNQIKSLTDKYAAVNRKLSTVETRTGVLEQTSQKMKTGGVAAQASVTSLTNRVGILEHHERDHSTQIKSLVTKDSAIESSLKTTEEKLSQEVTSRLADKTSLSSIGKKVNGMEQKYGDQSKIILTLKSKDAAIEKKLQDMDKKLSQEVTSRLGDKNTLRTYMKKVGGLERQTGDQSKKLTSFTHDLSRLDNRLFSANKKDAKQSQDIKDVLVRLDKSVTPALKTLQTLNKSSGNMSKQIKSLQNTESSLEKRISTLEKKHPKPKPTPTPKPKTCVKMLDGKLCTYTESG